MYKIIFIIFIINSTTSFTQTLEENKLYAFRSHENGKIGYMNGKDEIIVKAQYWSGTYFEDKCCAAVSMEIDGVEKFAVIDSLGNYVISFDEGYDLISLENRIEHWILVVKNGKWGYVDYNNEVMIPLEYGHLGDFYDKLAYAEKNNKYGFIDALNNVIIDFQYDWTSHFGSVQADGLQYTIVELDDKVGYINNKGELAIEYEYDFGYQFSKGIAIVKKGKKYGCINLKGKLIVPFEYENIRSDDEKITARKEFRSDVEYYFSREGVFLGEGKRIEK